jgi:hypothetical protein
MRLQSQRAGDIGNSDKNIAAPARATRFVLVLEPLPDIDAIRALRRILKHLLRQHGMRALLVRGIDTVADVSAAQSRPPPPGDAHDRRR